MSRKAVLNKDTISKLKTMARDDYWAGPGWGAATSRPFHVKQYLSEELNQKLLNRLEELRQEWKAKLDAVPKSKRFVGKTGMICDSLYNGGSIGFRDSKDSEVMKIAGKMLYAQTLKTGWFKNGRYWAEIFENVNQMPIDFGYYVNHSRYYAFEYNTFRIYWDAEKQKFYTVEFRRISTDPVEESKRRRNWGREAKKNEFIKKFVTMAKDIAEQCGEIIISKEGKISAWLPNELNA